MTQSSLFDYDPDEHVRRSDPDTSRDAASRLTTLNRHCHALLRAYASGFAMTAEEAGEKAGVDLWAASKRVSDLRRMLLIEPLVVEGVMVTRRNRSSNRSAEVCVITIAGRNKLAELNR